MAALTQADVENILESYESSGVTDVLYDMGKRLMDECAERIDYLDAKSGRIAGYAGAIVSLMVSTFPIWSSAVSQWAVLVAGAGMLVGITGGAFALASTWPGKFLLPSDSDWLEEDGLQDSDRLKRYYVASMHLTIGSHDREGAYKVAKLKKAQGCLAVMVLVLSIVFGNAIYRLAKQSFQPSSGHDASEGVGEIPFVLR